MKLPQAISTLGSRRALELAEQYCAEFKLDWIGNVRHVFNVLVNDQERIPGNISGSTESLAIKKWVAKFSAGYNNRASERASNPPGTVADPIIDALIRSRLEHLDATDVNQISYAHRLSMSAENILGLLLEEYLAVRLSDHRWHCAWGETVKSVDFVHENGGLLQVKNRSNSENSSSSAIRAGTEIKKWYRIKANRVEYMWSRLNLICNIQNLSEDDFVDFAINCMRENPSCLAVEQESPWLQPR
ncbi:MAG: SinI family restriction endonuclease [Thermoleophilia bacterium]|jgi:hypothetical protein